MFDRYRARGVARKRQAWFTRRGRRRTRVDVPVPVHAVCAACRGAIWGRDGRYRIGEREYHADCFDISLFGLSPGIRSDKAIG
jgi:hypothetical protein